MPTRIHIINRIPSTIRIQVPFYSLKQLFQRLPITPQVNTHRDKILPEIKRMIIEIIDNIAMIFTFSFRDINILSYRACGNNLLRNFAIPQYKLSIYSVSNRFHPSSICFLSLYLFIWSNFHICLR